MFPRSQSDLIHLRRKAPRLGSQSGLAQFDHHREKSPAPTSNNIEYPQDAKISRSVPCPRRTPSSKHYSVNWHDPKSLYPVPTRARQPIDARTPLSQGGRQVALCLPFLHPTDSGPCHRTRCRFLVHEGDSGPRKPSPFARSKILNLSPIQHSSHPPPVEGSRNPSPRPEWRTPPATFRPPLSRRRCFFWCRTETRKDA